MQGWVSFHRKIEEWEWYDDANTFRLFFHLVLKANHKDNAWRGIDIKRGELVTSNEQLAKQLKLTVSKIRTSLNKLKSTGEIAIKTTNKNTVVTVANYDLYQSDVGRIAIKPTNKPQSNRNQIATNNNDNNDNKETYRAFKHLSMSLEEYDRLISEGFTKAQIDDVIDSIENYAKNKSYTSLNLTTRKWLKREGIIPKKEKVSDRVLPDFATKGFGGEDN